MSPARARGGPRLASWLIGLLVIVALAVGAFVAFAPLVGLDRVLPWVGGYEVKAVFGSAQNLRPSSPVRIAGVEVGEVTEIENLAGGAAGGEAPEGGGEPSHSGGEGATVVTMVLEDEARPIHTDATFKVRPRLFLEGNDLVQLSPGSPGADEVSEGHVFALEQTSYSVQIDQILTTLQADLRSDLKTLLDQLGNALTRHGGAEGLRDLYRTSGPAFKFTAQVAEALLGTRPGDLGGAIRGLDRVVAALGRDEPALQDLVTNLRIVSGSFAARDRALQRAIEVLPSVLEAARPAFANLNAAFPDLRAFAREALPGVRSAPETLDAAIPFVVQLRKLVSRRELRGLVADLRPTIPELARLSKRGVDLLARARSLASCLNEIVIPWSQDSVDPVDPAGVYPHRAFGRVFEEVAYGLAGIASESRSGDANGQYIRVFAGGGANPVVVPNAVPAAGGAGLQDVVGLTPFPLLGSMPRLEDSAKTPFEPEVPCETQEPPNLAGGVGPPSGVGALAALGGAR